MENQSYSIYWYLLSASSKALHKRDKHKKKFAGLLNEIIGNRSPDTWASEA